MVHEVLGIQNGLVSITNSTVLDPPNSQVVLSSLSDQFYKENMYNDFGDLGIATKRLLDDFQQKKQLSKEIKSLEEMRKFVSEYPEFKKLSGAAMKHYALMEKLQQSVSSRKLLDLSEVEQNVACFESYTEATKRLDELISDSSYSVYDLSRLIMIYSLRYEEKDGGSNLNRYLKLLSNREGSDEPIKHIIEIINYGGSKQRSEFLDLFENKVLKDRIRKSIVPNVAMGVTNIFTQHKPLLCRIINSLNEGTLPEEGFPFYCKLSQNKIRPQQIVIFIVGGITYEEACAINDFNTKQHISVLLGGTQIHNSQSFIKAVSASFKESSDSKKPIKT